MAPIAPEPEPESNNPAFSSTWVRGWEMLSDALGSVRRCTAHSALLMDGSAAESESEVNAGDCDSRYELDAKTRTRLVAPGA